MSSSLLKTLCGRCAALALSLALLAGAPPALAAPDPAKAQALIERTTQEMLDVLRADARDGEIDVERMRRKMRDIILPHLDFVTMTKLAVGRSWRDATDEQKRTLVDEFRTLLVRTYTKSLDEYDNQELEFMPLSPGQHENRVTVRSRVIQSDGPEIPVEYRLRHKDDAWLVYDIVVDGVSLVTTYRSSFASQIEQEGIAGLIDRLKAKNADNAATGAS